MFEQVKNRIIRLGRRTRWLLPLATLLLCLLFGARACYRSVVNLMRRLAALSRKPARALAMVLAACMVFTMLPMAALATEGEAEITCLCEALCAADAVNPDCPVCNPEGADLAAACVGAPVMTVFATPRNGGTVTDAASLQTALGGSSFAAVVGDTVTLIQNVTLTEIISITAGTIILDLAGFAITGASDLSAIWVHDTANLTISNPAPAALPAAAAAPAAAPWLSPKAHSS